MARARVYRSRWLWLPAVAFSATAQGTAVVAYEATRPTPQPTLTIRLGDAAASWDFGIDHAPARVRQVPLFGDPRIAVPVFDRGLSVSVPAGYRIAVDGRVVTSGERVAFAARGSKVEVTAPDGTTWTRHLDPGPGQDTLLAVAYTPSRGSVLVTREGDAAPLVRCTQARCSVEVAPGTKLQLTALVGEDATFGGYHQYPMRTPPPLRSILGDPLAGCVVRDEDVTSGRDVRDCAIEVRADTDVAVEFGLQPKKVDVAIADASQIDKLLAQQKQKIKAPPAPIDAEKLEDKPVQLALKQPPPPEIKLQPQPKQEQPKPPPPPQQQPPENMTAVEVKDDHVVDKAPDDAKYLSDKNRDVQQETRATKTNLDKESEGKADASRQSDDTQSAQVGGPDDRIRQLEDTKPTTDKHLEQTDHSGDKQVAQGVIRGEGGDNGDNGTGERTPSELSMRGIEGRGDITDQGDGRKAGKQGLPGINTNLGFQDYERIEGKQKVDAEREVAARKMSSHKGRWERKLAAIQSSLENFVPDVQPGNQTALKTRAAPYAVYIARMHRRIHELWGFGYLADLDSKGADYPLNNFDLWVNLEISVNPDGTLHKVTIAKTSGYTEFDVAAVDTVISAGPYEPTPEAIRSVDGRIYLRWGFYRNWRQCGTFNVEPYILTSVPDDGGKGVLDDGAMVANVGHVPGSRFHREMPTGDKPVTPDDGLAQQPANPATTVADKQAMFAANQWVSAFATAQIDKLVGYSSVPFYANGKVAAQTSGDLKDMYGGLVVESGPMKQWRLLSPNEYTAGTPLPEGNVVVRVETTKAAFAIVLTKTRSGEYRATQLAR